MAVGIIQKVKKYIIPPIVEYGFLYAEHAKKD